jgi:hypothetical protein
MSKRRAQRSMAANRSTSRKIARSTSLSQNQAAEQETSEHPILTLQRQLGNATVSRLIASQRGGADASGQIRHKSKAATQSVSLLPDQAAHIPNTSADRHLLFQAKATISRAPGATSKKGSQAPASKPEYELYVLNDILDYHTARLASGMPSFEKLYMALEGTNLSGKRIADRDRREMFDQAILELKHVIEFATEEQKAYLQRKRIELFKKEASDRVDSTLTIKGKVVEMPGDLHPREQAAVFHQYLPTLRETIQIANEQILRLGSEQLEHVLEHIAEHGSGKAGILGKLAALNGLLGLADGWLTLSDGEFQKELSRVQGFFPTVTTYSELVKAVVEVGIGAVSLTASLAAGIAKLAGDAALTESAMGVAAKSGELLGNVVAGIEIVHGLFVLLDPKSTSQQKEKAAFGVASGGAWFIGGGPASFAVLATYVGAKIAAHLYWEGATGLTSGLMSQMWEWIKQKGSDIATYSEHVANANSLLAEEKDPTKAKYLAEEAAISTEFLAMHINDFLQHSLSTGKDMGWKGDMAIVSPGNVPVMVEAFAPLQHFRGVKSGPELLVAATQILNMITWCLRHVQAIEESGIRHKDLNDLIDDDTEAAKPKED